MMMGDSFDSDNTILVQRYAADNEIPSSYALLEFNVDFEEVRRQMCPLGTETLLLMIDNLELSDMPGDRFYSRTGLSDGRPPELVFVPSDKIASYPDTPSPPGIDDCARR
jgi:hypothetical protein